MALNVKQKYPGTQGGAAQLYASDTCLSLRRREQVFTRLSKSYKFVIKLFVFRHQRDQQLYIHLALHLLCLLISSRQCTSHRRLDFFFSNTNNLVQLEDTAIKMLLGYICSNSQKYIVWVKFIDFPFMPKIIMIRRKDHVPWRYSDNFLP